MREIIVSVDDVLQKVFLDPAISTVPILKRLTTEASILRLTRADDASWHRLAEEGYASLSDDVVEEIKALTGICINRRERSTSRTMESRVYLSDKAGIAATLSRGFSGYSCLIPARNESTLSITWFN